MPSLRSISEIIIHCSATPATMDIGRSDIDHWHKEKGWSGIGYHYVIRRDGRVEAGRLVTRTGAHARGYNRTSIGICLIGGTNDAGGAQANYSTRQWEALHALIVILRNIWPWVRIRGHRDLEGVKKACPSFDVSTWWNEVRDAQA